MGITNTMKAAYTDRMANITGSEKRERMVFRILIFIIFITAFIYNFATPMMTDDFTYGTEVRTASSFYDLLIQEFNQYMSWNGRSVAHLLLRVFLSLPSIVFKICNSLAFTWLTILIYLNISKRHKYDWKILLAAVLFMWFAAVDFSQTVLWETGAANYLWTTTIILSFMTFMRFMVRKSRGSDPLTGDISNNNEHRLSPVAGAFRIVLIFLFGVIAGWCSENTSGGCLLFVLFLILTCFERDDVSGKRGRAPAWSYAGAAGCFTGLMFMVNAPGNALRSAYRSEEHSGLYGMFSRFQKVTLIVEDKFLILFIILIITIATTILFERRKSKAERMQLLRARIVFAALSVVTAYALILTALTESRAYFGAGVFLIIACLEGIVTDIDEEKTLETATGVHDTAGIGVRLISYSVLAAASLYFVFMYMDNGANMMRLYRGSQERENYILEQKAAGNNEITVGQLHRDFDTEYSNAYDSDLKEDTGYWTNVGAEKYYGVSSITAVPYDDWAVMVGLETEEEAEQNRQVYAEEDEQSKLTGD
jgi:hypothetical protein